MIKNLIVPRLLQVRPVRYRIEGRALKGINFHCVNHPWERILN